MARRNAWQAQGANAFSTGLLQRGGDNIAAYTWTQCDMHMELYRQNKPYDESINDHIGSRLPSCVGPCTLLRACLFSVCTSRSVWRAVLVAGREKKKVSR